MTLTLSSDALAIGRFRAYRSGLNLLYVGLFFVCYYLMLSIYVGQSLAFPFFGAFLVATASFATNSDRIRRGQILALLTIFGILLLSFFVHYYDVDPVSKRLASLVDVSSALFSGYGFFLAFTGTRRSSLSRMFLIFALAILTFAVLERYLPVERRFSDDVRLLLYPRELVATDEARDVELYGAMRPSVFTSEPSLVGINLGLAIAIFYLMSRQRLAKKFPILCVLVAIGLYAVRSPTILFFATAALIGDLGLPSNDRPGVRSTMGKSLMAAVLVSTILVVPIANLLAHLFGGALERIVEGGSFYFRQVAAFDVAVRTLLQRPLFGFGIGGSEVLRPVILSVMGQGKLPSSLALEMMTVNLRPGSWITNGFWLFWVQFGLGTGAALVFAIRALIEGLGTNSCTFVFMAIALGLQTIGGLTDLAPIFMLFAFIAVARHRELVPKLGPSLRAQYAAAYSSRWRPVGEN